MVRLGLTILLLAVTSPSLLRAQQNPPQIKAAGLPERFAPWTEGFLTTPQWLELVYRSLEK